MRQRFAIPESKSQFILATILLLLLPSLAALQYHWLGQLSESTQQQMKAGLRATAARIGEDFDREITEAYAAFLPAFKVGEENLQRRYAVCYARWRESARYPRLVKAVYLAELDDAGRLRLSQLNPSTQRLEDCDWPAEMNALQQQLERLVSGIRDFAKRLQEGGAPPNEMIRPLRADIPAMLIPIPKPSKIRPEKEISVMFPPNFVIVTLDTDCVAREMLPALMKRHFAEGEESNYVAAVTGRDPQRLIFQPATMDFDSSTADASANFFRLLPDNLPRLPGNRMRQIQPPDFRSRSNRRFAGDKLPGTPIMLMGMAAPKANEQDGLWRLHLRHRSGSLEAAVAQARRQNLLLSCGILILLAAAVAMLALSARRARRLARQQMDFVAGVSHELRTPITVIDSAAYNLAKGVTRNPDQIQSYGRIIRKQMRQLQEMVEQTLEFAGIQSGRQLYNLQPLNLNHLLDEMTKANQPLLDERGFQLHQEIQPALPPVLGDGPALARALQNLLSNAMKYSGEGRWIGLQAGVDSAVQPPQVTLALQDRGLGIPEEDLPRIFEPFYRGGEARAAQIHGNGLGLSLVKNIIQAHHGEISVRSRAGEGSSFTIRLPIYTEKDEQTNSPD
jgi:two-component system, OmpR family, sensor histidine kinase SenX3